MTLPASEAPEPCVRFGPFRLYARQRVLLEDARPLRLGSRAFDILAILVGQAGATVSKAELIARVWPDTVVEETNLRVHVATLRKVLREGTGVGTSQRYIGSVPGRGYSFIAPVQREGACPPPPAILPPCPLPPAAGLVGRADCVAALRRQLRQRRLVTLVGVGGVGKTVLALTVVQDIDDACLVDLSALPQGAALPHLTAALAEALGLLPATGLPGVLALLRERGPLLVLDGCEHVIDAAAALAELLLRQAPRLRILATSREALRASDEWVHHVAPLACPPRDCADASAWPAAALFAQRAGLDLATLNDADTAAVGDICRQLDGEPLALELAAVRTDLFNVRELAARLDERLQLLKGGRRTAPRRHHSLRASLDWSHATLLPRERAVLRRLALFEGEFTLASAAVVAGDETLGPPDIEDAVAALHERSLLATRHTGTGLRCRLAGSWRHHALALLAAADEEDRVRLRFLDACALLVRAGTDRRGCPDDGATEDLRAALAWAFSQAGFAAGAAAAGVRLLLAAQPLWARAGLLAQQRPLLEQALLHADADTQARLTLYAALRQSPEGRPVAVQPDKGLAHF